METYSTQQEILLFTGTTFSSRQWCGKDAPAESVGLSDQERLQQACWDGLLPEMLPELFNKSLMPKKLFLWKIMEGSSFLELDLGEFPEAKEQVYSIDPYLFLEMQSLN